MVFKSYYFVEYAGLLPNNVMCFHVRTDEKDCCALISCTLGGIVKLTPVPGYDFPEEEKAQLTNMVKTFCKGTRTNSDNIHS